MTQSIPSGFSFEELQELLAAKQEENSQPAEKLTPEQLEYIAEKALAEAGEEAGRTAAVVHKLMILMACNKFVAWHTRVSENQMEDGEIKSGVCWARDAGKFQAIMDILMSISVGEDDFTFHAE